MKNFKKIVIFIFIFFLLLYGVVNLLWLPPSAITDFYKEPKNSIDVAYFGSSNVFAHFNTVLAYDLYGYTTAMFSANSQPFALIKYGIKEVRKTQNPSVYVIDITTISRTLESYTSEEMRKTIDTMNFSQNRTDAINEMLSYKKDTSKQDYINMYFSFLLYHNKWKNISKENVTGKTDLYKGYLFSEMTSKIMPMDKHVWTNNAIELDNQSKQALYDLIDYIKENNMNALFVIPKRSFGEEGIGRLNSAAKIIQENGFDIINCNLEDKLDNIDWSTDFYNDSHLNVYGATKYTLYFSKYLKEHYKLENHKGDEEYKSWETGYKNFKRQYKNLTNKDFDDLLLQYNS